MLLQIVKYINVVSIAGTGTSTGSSLLRVIFIAVLVFFENDISKYLFLNTYIRTYVRICVEQQHYENWINNLTYMSFWLYSLLQYVIFCFFFCNTRKSLSRWIFYCLVPNLFLLQYVQIKSLKYNFGCISNIRFFLVRPYTYVCISVSSLLDYAIIFMIILCCSIQL